MKLFKYNQFLEDTSINENLDKSKKFMKDTFILKSSIEKIGIDNLFSQKEADDLKYELDRGKKIITPSDCIGLDAEKRKLLSDTMRTISVPDDKLRELITTDEFKSIREIKCVVDEKEYQLDRDNIAWLFNFVYFYYAENTPIEDLTLAYTNLIQNKEFLNTFDKPFDLNFIDIKVTNNFEKLQDFLNKIPLKRFYKKFESDLPTHLKRDLKEAPQAIKDQFSDMASGFGALTPDQIKGFWGQMMLDDREGSRTKGQIVFRSPISRFKNIRELIENGNGYLKSVGNGSFDEFYQKFQDCNLKFQNSGADQIFLDNNILIIEVKSYGANRILNGHTTHCIVTSLNQWNGYVENDRQGRSVAENRQYYIYNFNLLPSDSQWTIGITIEPDPRTNYIRAAHNKTDGNVSSSFINIMKKWGEEYGINDAALAKAKQLGAPNSDIEKYGPVFCLFRPITSDQLEFRRKSREAEIEIVKPGKTKEQIEEYVKKWGANINHQDRTTKLCALDHAVREDDLEKAKAIISLGGTPNLRTDKKEAIINGAKSLDMVKLLVENQSIMTPQCYETISSDVKAVEYLLDNNVDPNFENSLPVRRSCKGSFDDRNYSRTGDKGEPYIDTLKLLIERGVKLSDARVRIMILKWASEYGRGEILQICDEMGIDFGWIAAYTWANNSMKLNSKDLKEFAPLIIPYIEKYEGEQWKALSNDKKWHLSL
jgi:hypothetical protein